MALINPSNAVIAKARAKYGKRLAEKDYAAMIKCDNVTEVVMYLKSYTSYSSFLSKVSTSNVHRGQVEQVLKEQLFEDFLSLCRYQKIDSPVTAYLLRQTEIDELIRFITLLSIDRTDEYIFSLPLYFIEHTELNLEKFSNCHSYHELLNNLKGTAYQSLLADFHPNSDGVFDIPEIEDHLENFALKELYKAIDNKKDKQEKNRLKELIDFLVDLDNYSRIIRLKKFYNFKNEDIRARLLPYGTFTKARLDTILSNNSYDEIVHAMKKTKVAKKLTANRLDEDSEIKLRGRYIACRHMMYFSTSPEVALLSYYTLCEVERHNVISIIEGIRYSLDKNIISEMLIHE